MPEADSPRARLLNLFLCHSSRDKSPVRTFYRRLKQDGFDPWLDEEKLLPGQDWEHEIRLAVRRADLVVVCLSPHSTSKAGFVHKEIRLALDVADEKPDGTLFIIPAKLEECEVPDRLRRWHWVNLFEEHGYEKLLRTFQQWGELLGAAIPSAATAEQKAAANKADPGGRRLPHTYYIGIETVSGNAGQSIALTVAPFGMEEGTTLRIPDREFGLIIGETAEFRFFYSATRKNDAPGTMIDIGDDDEIEELSPVEVNLPGHTRDLVPVTFETVVTVTGILQLWCISRDGRRWTISMRNAFEPFNSRQTSPRSGVGEQWNRKLA